MCIVPSDMDPSGSQRNDVRASTSEPAGASDVTHALGAKIREERLRANLSLRALASRTGLSPSLISAVERGRATPSVSSMASMANALHLSLADLFDDGERVAPGAERRGAGTKDHRASVGKAGKYVLRPSERMAIALQAGVTWERLTPEAEPDVDFLYSVYPVGSESCAEDRLMSHTGREYGFVLGGVLGVQIGFEKFELHPSDSVALDSSQPHRLWAIGDEPARAIWLVLGRWR